MRTIRPRTLGLIAAAAVVALGCGNGDEAERSNDLVIEAGDLYYEPDAFAASAGEVSFSMENVGAVEHDLVIEELGDTEIIGLIDPGETGSGSISLDAGTYTLYCNVVGHREAGMEATLDVE